MNPASVTQEQFLTSLRYLIATAGAYAAGKGWITNNVLNSLLTVAAVLGPLAWGLYANWQKSQQTQMIAAVGVQAGINMTVQGKALSEDGSVVSHVGANTTPAKPVTLATSDKIIHDFGPAGSTIEKV